MASRSADQFSVFKVRPTLYHKNFAMTRKLYRIGLLFTNDNGVVGAISVTE